jgi:iron complex outermembrane receptor protein
MAANGLDAGAHIIYIGNKNFESEFSWQQDIGVLASDPNYSASVSLFNKNIQNFIYLNQVTINGKPIVDAQGNRTFQYQQSSAQLYGLEATFDLHPTSLKGFSWSNQFALCYGFNRKQEFEGKGKLGEYLPFIPPPHLQSVIAYERSVKFGWFSSMHGSLECEYTANQNRYLALFDTETRTPGYSLVNAGIGFDTASDKRTGWQLQFQVNNFFDVAYQSNLSRLKYFEYFSQSPTGRTGIYSMGRNFCIKLIFTF